MSLPDVLTSIEGLPDRFRPDHLDPVTARFRLRVGNVERDVVVDGVRCSVDQPIDQADVEIETGVATWRAIEAGKLSGIEAFADRKLSIRGSIEKSLQFEPLFERPDNGGMRYALEHLGRRGGRMSALIAGNNESPPLVLLHGLGATKASWLTVVPRLAKRYRVVALDLPGFGASAKPIARYDAKWFAQRVVDALDELAIDRTFVAGNSMGGRIAMELAMTHAERVEALACLCPAAAFSRRPALGLVRFLRPEAGIVATRLPRARILSQLRQLFADPGCVEDSWYEAAVDDFLSVWKSPRARISFFAALRNIYLDEPDGDEGFWTRLARLPVPALFVYGQRDLLITHHFGKKVQRMLPAAKVVVWNDCGHVPQIEFPERTADLMTDFFAHARRAEATA
jgi:pimeloyl-ACP methyl ester carboxylesterase